MPSINIVPFNAETAADILALRHQVFTLEQGVKAELDIDGEDDAAQHCVIYTQQQIIATGRLLGDGHIGRVAVSARCRGQGLGRQVMMTLMNEAMARGYAEVYLHAQITAIGFYHKLGFKEYGEVFLDAGINHIAMKKRL